MTRQIKKFQSAVTFTDEMKHQLEQLRSASAITFTDEMKRNLEQLRSIAAPPFTNEIKHQLEQLRAATAITFTDEMKRNLEQLRSIAAPPFTNEIKHQLEQLRAATAITFTDEMKRNFDTLTANLASQMNLGRLFGVVAQRDFSATLGAYVTTIDDDEFDDLHLQLDGSVVVDGEQITPSEMQEAVGQLFDQAELLLSDIGEYLTRFRKPLRKVIKFLLQAILGAFIQIILTPYWDQSTTIQIQELQDQLRADGARTRREIQAAIKELAQSNQDFSQWRVVSARHLNVKPRRASRANNIASLPLGTVVRMLDKHGGWAMVEYESPDTNTIETGWVYSKYLQRIR